MSTTTTSAWPKLEQPNTSNATFIDWQSTANRGKYDPNKKWRDGRFTQRVADYYQNLDDYNNGYKNGKYRSKSYYAWLENDRIISTISGQLELTGQERPKAKGLYHQLTLGDFWGHKEDTAVVVCLYVIEHNERDKRRGHPATIKNWQFDLIEQTLGVSRDKIQRNYGRLEYRVRTNCLRKAPQHDKYRNSESFSSNSVIEYEQISEQKAIEDLSN